MDLSFLTHIGFTQNDIQLYTTLVESGPQNLTAITKKAGINRTSAYYMLEKLIKRGLVKVTVKGGKRKIYVADDPKHVLRLYDDYVDEITSSRKELKKQVQQLSGLYANASVTPKITFYQGKEGVKKVMAKAFNGDYPEVLSIHVLDQTLNIVGSDWFKKFVIDTHVEENVLVKVLRVEEEMKRQPEIDLIEPEEPLLQRRILPKSFDFTVSSFIYGNNVAYISSKKESYAMTMHSEELTTMQREIFNYLWSVSMPHKMYKEKFKK